SAMSELLDSTQAAFENSDDELALQVEPLQQVIHELIREVKNRHIERLKNKNCTIELGFVLSDLLNSYERAASHCSNIAVAVIEAKRDSYAPHEYLRNYRKDEKSSFKEIFNSQKEKYTL
ncbi:MAG: PhoU domain-containing protein, partial [Oscillospiraceae bacterium]